MVFNYKIDENDYFTMCSCGCSQTGCSTYDGEVPEGFPFEVDIRCYKLVTNGGVQSIVYDDIKAAELHEIDVANDAIYATAIKGDIVNLQSQISEQEEKNIEQDASIANHGTRITKIELDLAGVENDLKNNNNNLLFGTDLSSQKGWFDHSITGAYVESETAPTYSSDWWFGGYWYCTKTQGEYTKSKMYHYDNGSWVLSNETRSSLNKNKYVSGVELTESDYSKTNFVCGKMATFNTDGTGTVGLEQGVTPISNTFENLMLSYKMRNSLSQGEFLARIEFYNKYDLNNYLRTGTTIPMYSEEFIVRANEITDLSQIEMKVPIQKLSQLITGSYGNTAPVDTTEYWINSSDNKLYEYDGTEWVLSNKNNTLKYGSTYYNKVRDGSTDNYVYTAVPYNIEDYITLCARVVIEANLVWVEYVGETAPTPKKGLYWGQASTDKVFRADYIDDVFSSWVEIDTTYTEAVANGIVYETPLVYPKGSVIVSDIKLEYENRTEWSANTNEILGRNIDIDDNGITISDGENTLQFNEDEIKVEKRSEKIFDVVDDLTYTKRHKTLESDIDGLITKKMNINGNAIYGRYIR